MWRVPDTHRKDEQVVKENRSVQLAFATIKPAKPTFIPDDKYAKIKPMECQSGFCTHHIYAVILWDIKS